MKRNIIYHYCKMESFFTIIKNKKIWLSNAFKTNDFKEIKYVLEVLQYPNIDTDFDNFRREYEEWITTYMRPHIACFSKNGDVLSQWRGYADDGKGVSIGFSRDYFESISKLENKETKISDVIYDVQDQKEMLLDFIKELDIEGFSRLNSSNFSGLASTVLASELIHFGLVFKHNSFREEDEVRIIHGHNELFAESESLRYRATDNNLISYIELPIDNDRKVCPVVEVILGPKNMSDARDIREFIQCVFGVDKDIIVKRSESSYR